ncbi:MAG: AzlC family ABC transporter permease [Lachnospiraceae bacterium]|nr:AzlC family ABC transporter permease [Lachnospiraceae bacterium]
MKDFIKGFKGGIPIGLGYIPVSFTFGFMAVSGGLPIWLAIFISMSNLTSSGQFAGTNLILADASYFEITITTFIINIRYMLMSLSLSQKLKPGIGTFDRLLFSFGITDETFAVASMEKTDISPAYMYGLISFPYIGWTSGTILGAYTTGILPNSLKGAMGIALFAMFTALIIPPAKHSKTIVYIVCISIATTCMLKYIAFFKFVSSGFRIIISTFAGAGIGALLFPDNTTERIDSDD